MNKLIIPLSFLLMLTTSFQAIAVAPTSSDIIAGLGVMVNQLDSRQPPQLINTPVTGTQVGGIITAEVFYNSWFSVEVDAVFGDYQYVRQVGSVTVSETVTRVHVPVLFKANFLKYFAIGLGGYASYKMGEVKQLGNTNIQEEDRSSANDVGEHGLEGGISFIYPVAGTPYFIGMDFRQVYSLTPRSDEERFFRSFNLVVKKLL